MDQASSYRFIEGRNPVIEAIRAGTEIFEILMENSVKRDEKISAIKKFAYKNEINVKKLTRKQLEKLSRTGVHQGVIAKTAPLPIYTLKSILSYCEKKDKAPFLVVLTEVLYQYNLGALLRSALAAGVDAVIVPRKTKEPGPVTARASMGALEHIPLIYENIFAALKELKENGIQTVAAYERASKKYYDTNLRLPLALLIGGEDKGISDNMLSRIDEKVKIPTSPKVSSLNLSVAASILMFEIKRQNDV